MERESLGFLSLFYYCCPIKFQINKFTGLNRRNKAVESKFFKLQALQSKREGCGGGLLEFSRIISQSFSG